MERQKSPIRFNEVISQTLDVLGSYMNQDVQTVIIRDLRGRIRIAFTSDRESRHDQLAETLHGRLGAFSPGKDQILLFKGELFDPDSIFSAQDLIPLPGHDNLFLLERQITGQDWLREPVSPRPGSAPRATLFGIKGGVGRSTALTVWAWHLANTGKNVLVVDLDLESPGLDSLLLPSESHPTYGVVDWLVEDAVGQADRDLVRDMTASSPLSGDRGGSVRVVPAFGQNVEYAVAKLSRAYLYTLEPDGARDFASRIDDMLLALEEEYTPDVILLDSRAGLHDIAAVAITRLGATAYLFAVGSPQTWRAYRLLFEHWKRHPALGRFRDNLRMVAALTPEQDTAEYLQRVKEDAHSLWSETLYETEDMVDDEAVGGDIFNFSLEDEAGPHFPIRVDWNPRFREFNPATAPHVISPEQVKASYGQFLEKATLLFPGEEQ